MPSKKGDGALKHCDPGLSANPRHLLHFLVFSAESIYGNLQWVCCSIIYQKVPPHMRCVCFQNLPEFVSVSFTRKNYQIFCSIIYQKVSPHIAVTEVSMPVDCRGKLFHPLDLPQQLSHLNYPVTSVFLSLSLSVYFCLCLCLFINLFGYGFGSASAFLSSVLSGQIICPGRACPSESFAASPQVEPRWQCCNGQGREVHEEEIVGRNMGTEEEQTFSQG